MIPCGHIKVSMPIAGEDFPRDLLPPEGTPGSANASMPLTFRSPMGGVLTVTMKVKAVRTALKKADACQNGAWLILQCRLTADGYTDAGLTVQERKPREGDAS